MDSPPPPVPKEVGPSMAAMARANAHHYLTLHCRMMNWLDVLDPAPDVLSLPLAAAVANIMLVGSWVLARGSPPLHSMRKAPLALCALCAAYSVAHASLKRKANRNLAAHHKWAQVVRAVESPLKPREAKVQAFEEAMAQYPGVVLGSADGGDEE